jgi:hypothetical protein
MSCGSAKTPAVAVKRSAGKKVLDGMLEQSVTATRQDNPFSSYLAGFGNFQTLTVLSSPPLKAI